MRGGGGRVRGGGAWGEGVDSRLPCASGGGRARAERRRERGETRRHRGGRGQWAVDRAFLAVVQSTRCLFLSPWQRGGREGGWEGEGCHLYRKEWEREG